MRKPNEHRQRFADWLDSLADREDKAVLAALRRGLSVESAERSWMLRYLPPLSASEREEEAMCFVASLFAYHPLSWRSDGATATNIGSSLRVLAQTEMDPGDELPDRIESRLEAVIQSHRNDLPEHLRRIVGLLKAKEIPVDWAQLLHDIMRWDLPYSPVQREWARAFWRSPQKSQPDSGASEAAPGGSNDEEAVLCS